MSTKNTSSKSWRVRAFREELDKLSYYQLWSQRLEREVAQLLDVARAGRARASDDFADMQRLRADVRNLCERSQRFLQKLRKD
jgi:hypothetical protein